MKNLIGFLIGVLIASILLLNFMEYSHIAYEHNPKNYSYCYLIFGSITKMIGQTGGEVVKFIYKVIVYPTKYFMYTKIYGKFGVRVANNDMKYDWR